MDANPEEVKELNEAVSRLEDKINRVTDDRLSRSFQSQMANSSALGATLLNIALLILHMAVMAIFYQHREARLTDIQRMHSDSMARIEAELATQMTWIQTTRESVQKLENEQ